LRRVDLSTSQRARADVEALIAGACGGDESSIEELLSHFRAYLTLLASRQIQRRLRPRVSPSDVVQETMLRAHLNFGQFRGRTERELLAWLREILLSRLARFVEQHILAAKRDIRREVSFERLAAERGEPPPGAKLNLQPGWSRAAADWDSADARPADPASPELKAPAPLHLDLPVESARREEHGDPSAVLADLLARLPEHYREVLKLRNIQGLSFEEVAAKLDRSPGATRMLWLRAIEKLRAVYRRAEQP
jgi:RNA polymerase sigma-70 factor (ECF subfamily)